MIRAGVEFSNHGGLSHANCQDHCPDYGVFRSVEELIQAIRDYIGHHNAHPKSFVWTKKAEDILEKVTRARAALSKVPSA